MSGRQLHKPVKAKRPARDAGHCGRTGCRCTHTPPCDHGWIDAPDRVNHETGMVYEQVAPCPVCRPDAADRMAAELKGTSRDA